MKLPSNTLFRFVTGGNTVGDLLISLLLKGNDSYCHFSSRQEKEKGEPGATPPENFFRPSLFHVRKTPFLKREGTTKRSFHSYCDLLPDRVCLSAGWTQRNDSNVFPLSCICTFTKLLRSFTSTYSITTHS